MALTIATVTPTLCFTLQFKYDILSLSLRTEQHYIFTFAIFSSLFLITSCKPMIFCRPPSWIIRKGRHTKYMHKILPVIRHTLMLSFFKVFYVRRIARFSTHQRWYRNFDIMKQVGRKFKVTNWCQPKWVAASVGIKRDIFSNAQQLSLRKENVLF